VKYRISQTAKWLALGLTFGLTLAATPGSAATQMLDSVVAIVEDDVIMSSELKERMDLMIQNLQTQGREVPADEILIRQTLDRLILESIQLQMGRRAGVRISDAQLNSALNRIAAQAQMSLDQFRIQLEKQGKPYQQMREDVRRELIIQRVQGGNVNQRIQITEQEIDNFLESAEGRAMLAEEYHLVHALLPLPEGASAQQKAAAKAHVDALYARILAGESYSEVISSSPSEFTFTGGDLGWRKADALPSLFADIAPGMDVEQTAPPILSASGYHLLFLAEKRGGSMLIQQTHVRHILLKPSAIRSNDETRGLASELRQRIIDGTEFEELAREYSEDIGSAQEGGDLGWTSPGQMVPEFENVMDSEPMDEISQPFSSEFGWHILQVLERRQEDVSRTVVQNRAGEMLHQRKYQEELDAWLRKIRDEAFVDIK
jgi:peptidyl-prolyl cis-trans isomerase SurA